MPAPDWLELPAHRRERLRLYLRGYSFLEIAAKLPKGVSRQAVQYSLKPVMTPELKAQHKQAAEKRKQRRQRAADRRLLKLHKEAFLDLIEEGVPRAALCEMLDVNERTVKILLVSLDEGTRRRWHATLRSISSKAFSAEEMTLPLQEAAALEGGKISAPAYIRLRKTRPHWPHINTYVKKGGWNHWVGRAGLPVNPRHPGSAPEVFSEADCRTAVEYVYEKLGNRLYSQTEYDETRRSSDPSGQTLRDRSGTWGWVAALEKFLPHAFAAA